MIRILAIIAAVSFVLAVVCLGSALALTGGPFYIDEHMTFHRGSWPTDITISQAPSPRAQA